MNFAKCIDNYGKVFAEFALDLQPGERVYVQSEAGAMPLIESFVRHATRRGAYPSVYIETPLLHKIIQEEGNLDQLGQTDIIKEALIEKCDARLKIFETTNPYSDQKTQADDRRAAIRDGRNAWYSKMLAAQAREEHPLKWTCGNYPCQAFAMRHQYSLRDYEDLVFRAAHCDKEDPVAANVAQEARMLNLADRLEGCKTLRIVAPGTDLRLGCAGRKWARNFDRANIPGSETATSPLEDSAEGHIYFGWPQGRHQGVRLEFQKGKCIKATCDKGDEVELNKTLDQDAGARLVGEFAFGLNNNITEPCGDTLFDEKIGGSIHIALGASYAELGGLNKSNLHWDLVCNTRDEGEVWVDDVLLLKDGKLKGIDVPE